LDTTTCANKPGEVRLFGIGWLGIGAVLRHCPQAQAYFFADVLQHLDFSGDIIQLFADHLAAFIEQCTIVVTHALCVRQGVHDIDARFRRLL
jgi:hypothetical protein